MSKKIIIFITFILVIVLAAFGLNYFNGVNPFSTVTTPDYIQSPVFGWYECLSSDQPKTISERALETQPFINREGSKWYVISCSDFAENDGCLITLVKPEEGFFTGVRSLRYYKCQNNELCTSTNDASSFLFEDTIFGQERETVDVSLSSNEYLFVKYTAGFDITENVEGATFFGSITPFYLYQTDIFHGGKQIINSQNCEVTNPLKSNIIQATTLNTITGVGNQLPNKINKGEPVNYISTFVPITTANLEIQEYNNQLVQCRNKALYPIEEVKFGDQSYFIANSNLQQSVSDVDCCNGDFLPGFVCQDNKWIEEIKQESCSSFNPCPGSSQYRQDTTQEDDIYVISQCIENECVFSSVQATCSAIGGCGANQVCDVNLADPTKNKCVDLLPGTPPPSTPQDLQEESQFSVLSFLVFLFGILGGLIITVVFDERFSSKYNKGIKYIMNLFVFVISFILVAIIANAILEFFQSSMFAIVVSLIIAAVITMFTFNLVAAFEPKTRSLILLLVFILVFIFVLYVSTFFTVGIFG